MSKKRNKPSWIKERQERFANYMLYFENLASTIFIWRGLPKELRSGWIERRLFNDGQLLWFAADWKREQYDGMLCLPLAHFGALNAYGELVDYMAISPLRTFKRNYDNSVLIRNNELRLSTYQQIYPLVWELADIDQTIKVNRNSSCKTPIIVSAGERTQLSALNLIEEMTENKPAIVRDINNEQINIETIKGAEYHGTELLEMRENIFNRILTIMGIISNPVVKAERVNTIESASNRGLIIDTLDSMLMYRQEAVDRINELFVDEFARFGSSGLSVEINNIYTRSMMEQGLTEMVGGVEDEGVNNEPYTE